MTMTMMIDDDDDDDNNNNNNNNNNIFREKTQPARTIALMN